MKNNLRFLMGLAALVLVLVLGGALYLWSKDNPGTKQPTVPVTITCAGGSEKTELMADPDVAKLLLDKHNLKVSFVPMGSFKQVMLSTDDLQAKGYDCLWPSSASARSVFEARHKGAFKDYRAANVLQSPEVIYSGPNATAALIKAGVVTKNGKVHQLDVVKLVNDHMQKGSTWQSLKATDLAGPVRVRSTDPRTSNSGFVMQQLMLTVLATKDATTPPTLGETRPALPAMRKLYESAGLQAGSSEDGFRQWLTQGGEYSAPLYAGYENQLIQQYVDSGKQAALLQDVTILYPTPTIYSDHPVLALQPAAHALLTAMQDADVQKIAWERYGFRSGTNASINSVQAFSALPLAARVRTIPAPNADVTVAMLDCLESVAKCS